MQTTTNGAESFNGVVNAEFLAPHSNIYVFKPYNVLASVYCLHTCNSLCLQAKASVAEDGPFTRVEEVSVAINFQLLK